MRRLLAAGLAGLLFTAAALTAGCDSKGSGKPPEKTMELPKEGPQPVGAPKGGGGGGTGPGKNSSDQ